MLSLPSWLINLGVTMPLAAGAGFAVFQFLGKRWIESKFAERLEKFKHEQNQEIEKLRFRINALMDRTSKLHQNEFEVLPTIWEKLREAYWKTIGLTSAGQTNPDLDNMSPTHFSEFVDKCQLKDWEKEMLKETEVGQRNRAFAERIRWHRYVDVRDCCYDFRNYFESKGIFVQQDLKARVHELSAMIFDALFEAQMEAQTPRVMTDLAKIDLLHREGRPALESIEAEIQSRLWDANKLG